MASPMHWFQRCFLSRDLTKEPTLSWQKLQMFQKLDQLEKLPWFTRDYVWLYILLNNRLLSLSKYHRMFKTYIPDHYRPIQNVFTQSTTSNPCHVRSVFYRGSEILFYLLAEQIIQKMPLFSGEAKASEPTAPVSATRFDTDLTPFP